ncbi:12142_t:CDS:2, partial [Funneliformis geosporum]
HWLNVLGYFFQSQKQGIYHDRYKHSNVIRYKQLFLDTIFNYGKCITKYKRENIKWIPSILELNEKEIVFVMHDENMFYSNNGK